MGADGDARTPTASRCADRRSCDGVDVDMNAISDTAPTLAALAPFADAPVRIRNVAHLRRQESDRLPPSPPSCARLGGRVEELRRRLADRAVARCTAATSTPTTITASRWRSRSIGLQVPGVGIRDPGCVQQDLSRLLRAPGGAAAMTPIVVAIDGPAGAGKSTVSRRLAQALGYRYVDTGAMYRVIGVLAPSAASTSPTRGAGGAVRRHAHGLRRARRRVCVRAPTGAICRTPSAPPAAAQLASKVSAVPVGARAPGGAAARHGRRGGGVVMEGRDIGTVVFPDAPVKIFLDASARERARRRAAELAGARRGGRRRAHGARDRRARRARPRPRALAAAAGGRRGGDRHHQTRPSTRSWRRCARWSRRAQQPLQATASGDMKRESHPQGVHST